MSATLNVTGHNWDAPVYTWNDDNTQVTATRTCKHDAEHAETETVAVTAEITKPATYEDKGETTYSSDAFTNEAFEIQTKTLDGIDMLKEPPGITDQPTSMSVAVGSSGTFRVTATGATSYQWQYRKNSSSTTWTNASGTAASFTVKGNKTLNGYQYRCKVTNANGTTYSNIVTLTVN